MNKYLLYLLLICSFLFGGCQSVEQISIDYMLPAAVSFPSVLKRVAVVNNMPDTPNNKLIVSEKDKHKSETEIARKINYYNGNASLTAESLAQTLANENYFTEVVICDSALRTKDITARESTLTRDEVNKLTQDLNVDFLIALENVQMRVIRKIEYMPEFAIYYGTVDAKVFPTVKVYLPNRSAPMVTINSNDSIFWEEFGGNDAYIRSRLIDEKEMLKEASTFAGTIPVKQLLPYWKTASRYIFSGGSVNMRDAAVYARRKQWGKAIELWKQTYQMQKGKQKMQAAYNIAFGYEMQDSIETSTDWALNAQIEARKVDKVDKRDSSNVSQIDLPNYVLTTLYVAELQERKEGIVRLNTQMNRFTDDF